MADPKRTVLLTMLATGTIVTLDQISRGNLPKPRSYIGLAAVWVVLSFTADRFPQAAAPFAVLLLVGQLATRGPSLFRTLGRGITGQGSPQPAQVLSLEQIAVSRSGKSAPVDRGNLERIYRDVKKKWPRVSDLGTTNCRKQRGGSEWSKHAWSEAKDIGVAGYGAQRFSTGTAINAWLNTRREKYGITKIIWLAAGHFGHHLHVEIGPDRTGETPPCAGA